MKNKSLILLVILTVIIASCNLNEKKEKYDTAFQNSQFIMENLDKKSVVSQFPEKYFKKEQTLFVIDKIAKDCNWDNREGKYVDDFVTWSNNKNRTAFIYEYYLLCDSARFILTYDMDQKVPELISFEFEPIEKKSPLITDPSKQLH